MVNLSAVSKWIKVNVTKRLVTGNSQIGSITHYQLPLAQKV